MDQSLEKFYIENKKLLELIVNAKKIFERKGNAVKRKGIVRGIADAALGIAGILGIGALLISGGVATAIRALYLASGVVEPQDEVSKAYSALIASIGDRRTALLLENYVVTYDGKVEFIGEG